MPPKKINLKSSVNAINAKATVGKKKHLAKLKVILANPYKPTFETLIDSELSQLKDLISSEIKLSGTSGRQFARQNNIYLGLGSSLRAIGNNKASCVLISRSIKPKFIINQIGLFAKQTNNAVPVLIVEDWDNISANLFGVRALVVVFPLNISGQLGNWISKRTLLTKPTKTPSKDEEMKNPDLTPCGDGNKLNLNSMYLPKPSNGTRAFVPDIVIKPKLMPTPKLKEWTGDFISFSNSNEANDEIKMDIDEVDEEFKRKQYKALDAFEKIAMISQEVDIEHEPKDTNNSKEDIPEHSEYQNLPKPNTECEEWERDQYISLEVHKIQPNPKRKPKNKKKNKKQKQKQKP